MKTHRPRFPKPLVTGIIGLVLSAAVIGGAAFFTLRRSGPVVIGAQSPGAAVSALADAVNRSDADAAMRYIDAGAIYDHLFKRMMEANLQKQLTDEQLKPYAAKSDPLRAIMRQAVLHGITTKADKDGATDGTLLYALIHLSEGRIEAKETGRFSVVFADGASLDFEKRGDSWVAVGFNSTDARIQEYRKAAENSLQVGMKAAQQGSPAAVNASAGGAQTGN